MNQLSKIIPFAILAGMFLNFCTDTSGQTPYRVRKFSVNSHTFYDYLPFDVPFIIVGDIDATVFRVRCRYRISKDDCTIDEKDTIKCDCGKPATQTCWVQAKDWNRTFNNKDSSQFAFIIRPLAPNKSYEFYIEYYSRLQATELLEFQTKTAGIIQDFLKNNRKKNLDDTVVQNKLNDAVKCLGGTLNYGLCEQTTGNLVKTIADHSLLIETLSAYTLNANLYLHGDSSRTVSNIKKVSDAISLIANNQDLFTLIQKLNRPQPDKRLRYLQMIYKLKNDPDKLRFISTGEEGLDTASGPITEKEKISIKDYWIEDTVRLNATIWKYQKTVASLETAGKYIEDIELQPNLQVQTGLDINDLNMLFNEIKSAVSELNTNVGKLSGLKFYLIRLNTEISSFSKNLSTLFNQHITVKGSASNNFVTRSKNYMSLDLGIAYITKINQLSPYIGTNIYFRPVNKEMPLSMIHDGHGFYRRFSLVAGLTLSSFSNTKKNDISNLIGNFNLVTGAGFRVTDAVRISGGCVWYSASLPGLPATDKYIGCSPMVSISVDADIKTFINKLLPSGFSLSDVQ